MSLLVSELSKRNKYYISKHRYLELKHFCLQYPEWKKKVESLNYIHTGFKIMPSSEVSFSDPVGELSIKREVLLKKIDIVEGCSEAVDFELSPFLLEGVTRGRSYEYLAGVMGMPCSRGTYYDRYRKFFFVLDKLYS